MTVKRMLEIERLNCQACSLGFRLERVVIATTHACLSSRFLVVRVDRGLVINMSQRSKGMVFVELPSYWLIWSRLPRIFYLLFTASCAT